MVSPSTISDLRAEIQRLQEQKRRIDRDIQALETTLRYFEGLEEGQHSEPKQSNIEATDGNDELEDEDEDDVPW